MPDDERTEALWRELYKALGLPYTADPRKYDLPERLELAIVTAWDLRATSERWYKEWLALAKKEAPSG